MYPTEEIYQSTVYQCSGISLPSRITFSCMSVEF